MSVEYCLLVSGVVLYGLASILAVVSLVRSAEAWSRAGTVTTILGAGCLAAVLVMHGTRAGRLPVFGWFEASTFYCLLVTAAYLFTRTRSGTRGLSIILMPYLTALVVLGATCWKVKVPVDFATRGAWHSIHILTAFVGYAMFTMASIMAIAYILQDHMLKRKRLGAIFHKLPALGVLESLMYRQISPAFVVFSISILLGILLTHLDHWGPKWVSDPKVVATAVTWLVYAILFHLRMGVDYHGRKVAIVTIVGLACVLFAFFGVHLVADSMHNFVSLGGGP